MHILLAVFACARASVLTRRHDGPLKLRNPTSHHTGPCHGCPNSQLAARDPQAEFGYMTSVGEGNNLEGGSYPGSHGAKAGMHLDDAVGVVPADASSKRGLQSRIPAPFLSKPVHTFRLNQTVLRGLNLTEKAEKIADIEKSQAVLIDKIRPYWRQGGPWQSIRTVLTAFAGEPNGTSLPGENALAGFAQLLTGGSSLESANGKGVIAGADLARGSASSSDSKGFNSERMFPPVEVPTLVPGQDSPLLRVYDDFICNDRVVGGGCVHISELGRAIGGPLNELIGTTNIAHYQSRISDALEGIHDRITRGITPTFIDYLEREPLVQIFESALKKPPALDEQGKERGDLEGTIFKFLNQTYQDLYADTANLIDPALPEKYRRKEYIRSQLELQACRTASDRYNLTLPFCPQDAADKPPEEYVSGPMVPLFRPPIPIGGKRNSLGFWNHVYVFGFQDSCVAQGTCIAGTADLEPENFDGIYQFDGLENPSRSKDDLKGVRAEGADEIVWPRYVKVQPLAEFRDFPLVDRLYLWQKAVSTVDGGGLWASITPEVPGFDWIDFGPRAPYAFFNGFRKPPRCKRAHDFPTCLTDHTGAWRFARLTASSCNGVTTGNICFFPAKISIFPTPFYHVHLNQSRQPDLENQHLR